jgi:prevent-host-death family protein
MAIHDSLYGHKTSRGCNVMQVNILEAKNRLSQLIKSAQAGEEVVIANRGEPVARLVPAEPGTPTLARVGERPGVIPPKRPGGLLKWLDENPLPAYARRSAQEIDAAIQEERDAWD